MAKKKKDAVDALTNMVMNMMDGMPPEMQTQIMEAMNSGKSVKEMQEEMYSYQCPDYTQQVKPLADYLVPLMSAAKASEAIAAYEKVHEAMASLPQSKQEEDLRNFIMCILADGLEGKYGRGEDPSNLPLIVVFQLVDDFKLTGLFDVLAETLKQNIDFYDFYYTAFDDAAILMMAHVGVGHLDEMKEMMQYEGYVSEVYLIILKAAIQMVVENPFCRLQVLLWFSDVLKSCIDKTIPAMSLDLIVKSLAQIKPVELLPLLKTLYKEYNVPPMEIKGGIKGVARLFDKGTDERIVEFDSFREMLDEILKMEDDDFQLPDDDDEPGWIDLFLNECGEDCDDDDCDDDDDSFNEGYSKPARKLIPSNGKQKYALTIDVTLKGSPRKVYRQLLVPSDLELDTLGRILVYAVGWDGSHLNQFIQGKEYYMEPNEYDSIDMTNDASEYTIGDLLCRVGSKVMWEYDFGDSWKHEVKLVKKERVDDSEDVAVNLITAKGACPPDDCGGVWGYRHLLEVLKHPEDEEYEDMRELVPSNFDPKKFNTTYARMLIAAYMKKQ